MILMRVRHMAFQGLNCRFPEIVFYQNKGTFLLKKIGDSLGGILETLQGPSY